MVMGCVLATAVNAEKSDDRNVELLSVRVVDYHDQLEKAPPRSAGLEELVGKDAAERAPPPRHFTGEFRRTSASATIARRVSIRSGSVEYRSAGRRGVLAFIFLQPQGFRASERADRVLSRPACSSD